MKATYLSVVVVACLATACGKKQSPSAPPTTGEMPVTGTTGAGADAAAAPSAPGADAAVANPPVDAGAVASADAGPTGAEPGAADAGAARPTEALTAAQLEALVMAIGDCHLKGNEIEADCAAHSALRTVFREREPELAALADEVGALGLKILGHEKAALRIVASELLARVLGRNEPALAALLDTFGKDSELAVKVAIVENLGPHSGWNDRVAGFLEEALGHAELDVRARAVYALSAPINKRREGIAARLMQLAKSDPDERLRQVVCEHVGKLGDEAIMPTMKELTGTKASSDMLIACLKGLVSMWADHPRFENASEQAYRLTMEILERTPRKKDAPYWAAITRIAKVGPVLLESPGTVAKPGWKNRVRGWLVPSAVQTMLHGFILDADVDDQTVADAVLATAAFGEKRGKLMQLKATLERGPRMKPGGAVAEAFETVLTTPKPVNGAVKRDK